MFSRGRATGAGPGAAASEVGYANNYDEPVTPPHASTEKESALPQHHGPNGHHKNSRIKKAGESGRSFVHPWIFLYCCFRSSSRMSMAVNVLWPLVPVAIAVYYALPEHNVLIFTINYLAMIPAANLIGYAGQELGRKLPHVLGILIETTLGSVVEIILFCVLVSSNQIYVVRAAIVGSILANLLFCLGMCFIAGGLRRHEQVFHEVVSEVGSGLMLVAGMALILPVAYATATTSGGETYDANGILRNAEVEAKLLHISRATAVVLLIAYVTFLSEVLEGDERNDSDRSKDLAKKKLTFTECIIALAVAIACVSLIAVFLVKQIEPLVEHHGVPDMLMGLILVPFVEKFAEHLTAIDEAYDKMPNMALAHVLGASVQTALLNTPIVVIVGWGLGKDMDLNFKQFEAIVLIMSILVVGNFLRDGKSNYLEGVLMVLVYVMIAVCAYYYPNPAEEAEASTTEGGGGAAARLMAKALLH